jgi:hypothetical protein
MQKWEFCLLTGVSAVIMAGDSGSTGLNTHYPKLFNLTGNGLVLVTDFKDRPKVEYEGQSVARQIYLLGEEGWEIVYPQLNIGNLSNESYIWFKRQKA